MAVPMIGMDVQRELLLRRNLGEIERIVGKRRRLPVIHDLNANTPFRKFAAFDALHCPEVPLAPRALTLGVHKRERVAEVAIRVPEAARRSAGR